ncbi:MAG: YvrJ family protein, partial [Desulfotomaculales bacterium]
PAGRTARSGCRRAFREKAPFKTFKKRRSFHGREPLSAGFAGRLPSLFFRQKIRREVLLVEEALQALGTLVGNLGFPIAVCVFLLVRIEGRLSELAASIAELARAVEAGRK